MTALNNYKNFNKLIEKLMPKTFLKYYSLYILKERLHFAPTVLSKMLVLLYDDSKAVLSFFLKQCYLQFSKIVCCAGVVVTPAIDEAVKATANTSS